MDRGLHTVKAWCFVLQGASWEWNGGLAEGNNATRAFWRKSSQVKAASHPMQPIQQSKADKCNNGLYVSPASLPRFCAARLCSSRIDNCPQFWALTRPHAVLVAWEEPLFAAFRKHCISTWGKVPGCAQKPLSRTLHHSVQRQLVWVCRNHCYCLSALDHIHDHEV